MTFPVTINGNTYAEADFINYGHLTNFPAIIDDVATVAGVVATDASTAVAAKNIAILAGGYSYYFDNGTGATDPGSEHLRFNNATLASATALYVDDTTRANTDIGPDLATWDDCTSTIRGKLRVTKQSDASVYALFDVTGSVVDNTGWWTITVAYVTGNGSFTDEDGVTLQFIRNGDKGDTGATGATGPAGSDDLAKASVRVATTANGTFSTAFDNGSTIDGITLTTGDRILIKDQTDFTQNGIYVVPSSGSPTRATDADAGSELASCLVTVREGTANKHTTWKCRQTSITLGSTDIHFQYHAGGGGGNDTPKDSVVLGPGNTTNNNSGNMVVVGSGNTSWTEARIVGADNIGSSNTGGNCLGASNTLSNGSQNVVGNSNSLTHSSVDVIGNNAVSRFNEDCILGGGYGGGSWGNGKAQVHMPRLVATTTNNTVTEMLTCNNNRLTLGNNSTWAFKALIVARRTDADGECATYEVTGCIERNANAAATSLVGSVTKTVVAEDTAAWDVTVTADTTNGSLKIEVTGETSKTIRWVAGVWITEVAE